MYILTKYVIHCMQRFFNQKISVSEIKTWTHFKMYACPVMSIEKKQKYQSHLFSLQWILLFSFSWCILNEIWTVFWIEILQGSMLALHEKSFWQDVKTLKTLTSTFTKLQKVTFWQLHRAHSRLTSKNKKHLLRFWGWSRAGPPRILSPFRSFSLSANSCK